MGFKKYSESPLTLVEENKQPDWVKKANLEEESAQKQKKEANEETAQEDDSE